MEPALIAWLNHYKNLKGSTKGKVVPSYDLRDRLRAIRITAKIPEWHQDVMRHSYASYWLAKNEDINKLTLFMGHETTAMLWKHYHKAVKKTEADAYWSITPQKKTKPKPKAEKGAVETGN